MNVKEKYPSQILTNYCPPGQHRHDGDRKGAGVWHELPTPAPRPHLPGGLQCLGRRTHTQQQTQRQDAGGLLSGKQPCCDGHLCFSWGSSLRQVVNDSVHHVQGRVSKVRFSGKAHHQGPFIATESPVRPLLCPSPGGTVPGSSCAAWWPGPQGPEIQVTP